MLDVKRHFLTANFRNAFGENAPSRIGFLRGTLTNRLSRKVELMQFGGRLHLRTQPMYQA